MTPLQQPNSSSFLLSFPSMHHRLPSCPVSSSLAWFHECECPAGRIVLTVLFKFSSLLAGINQTPKACEQLGHPDWLRYTPSDLITPTFPVEGLRCLYLPSSDTMLCGFLITVIFAVTLSWDAVKDTKFSLQTYIILVNISSCRLYISIYKLSRI